MAFVAKYKQVGAELCQTQAKVYLQKVLSGLKKELVKKNFVYKLWSKKNMVEKDKILSNFEIVSLFICTLSIAAFFVYRDSSINLHAKYINLSSIYHI